MKARELPKKGSISRRGRHSLREKMVVSHGIYFGSIEANPVKAAKNRPSSRSHKAAYPWLEGAGAELAARLCARLLARLRRRPLPHIGRLLSGSSRHGCHVCSVGRTEYSVSIQRFERDTKDNNISTFAESSARTCLLRTWGVLSPIGVPNVWFGSKSHRHTRYRSVHSPFQRVE